MKRIVFKFAFIYLRKKESIGKFSKMMIAILNPLNIDSR